jgi:hypothetical protein
LDHFKSNLREVGTLRFAIGKTFQQHFLGGSGGSFSDLTSQIQISNFEHKRHRPTRVIVGPVGRENRKAPVLIIVGSGA